MSKLKPIKKEFNKETGRAEFQYRYKNNVFSGVAICHKDDLDFCSEMVGLDLAETRAYLSYLRVRRDELDIRYKTLKGFYNLISSDRNFDEDSSYAKKMREEVVYCYLELKECRDGIKNIPKMLDKKIKAREDMYQKLRKSRKESKKL